MLTENEKRLVYLVLRGYSNTRISGIMKASVSTIKNRLSKVFAKTCTSSRLELVHFYYRFPDYFAETAKPFVIWERETMEGDQDNESKVCKQPSTAGYN